MGSINDKLLQERFEEQAKKTPHHTAVEDPNGRISYQELNERANQLAHTLLAKGIQPEDICAVLLPGSISAVIAILGTLKAGAAYVPIDPSFPIERIEFLIQDTQAKTILTEAAYAHLIQPSRGLLLSEQPPSSTQNPVPRGTLSSLAYVLYTSGSTGSPKGALIEQRSLCNLIEAERALFGFLPSDRILQLAPLCFDVSVYEIFTTLITGATLCIPPQEARVPGPALLSFLQEERISVATLLPPVLSALPLTPLPHLRIIVTGGEPCPKEIVSLWGKERRFFNAYGPTETTIGATVFACTPGEEPCIGTPLPGVEVYLVDDELCPTPNGEKGEILIGGLGVARGYLNRPDLTQEKFLPNPFGTGRVYRTGDFGRLRPDGNLEFLGRLDQQIKLRGARVELGEIEALLLRAPGVKEAAVVLSPTKQQIFAYYVGTPSPEALQKTMAEALPLYMRPSLLLQLPAPVLTPNGKWDKARLPLPEGLGEYVAPTSETEALLCQLFSEVLGRSPVGVLDDFFRLGGDSLSLGKLLFRLQKRSPQRFTTEAFFQDPTPKGVAKALSSSVQSTLLTDLSLFSFAPPLKRGQPNEILLTGATGFFGIFLLEALLQHRDETIRCLVRANSTSEAQKKLEETAARYRVRLLLERIEVSCFDLTHPALGLSLEEWERLSTTTKEVFHCAAQVDLVRPYAQLKAANLEGTYRLLQLCQSADHVTYVSSLSALLGDSSPDLLQSGYAQSKWGAEQLLQRAQVPSSVYRPSFLVAHTQTGVCNPNDLFCSLVRQSIESKSFPALPCLWDLVAVDAAATAIVRKEEAKHLVSAAPLTSEEICALLQALGYPVSCVPYQSWLSSLPEDALVLRFASVLETLSLPQMPAPLSSWETSKEVLKRCLRYLL